MKIRQNCCLAILIALAGIGDHLLAQSSVEVKSPNIVLIMADDLGWKDLHCYGNEKLDTPNLDRLALQGVRFTDAYSASPVCTPTRAALMTGESPARLNITNHAGGHPLHFQKPGTNLITPKWLRHLPLEKVTLAEQLKGAGYSTGFVGKWHLSNRSKEDKQQSGPKPTEPELRPEHQGFDINVGGCRFGGPPSYFSPYKLPNVEGKFDGEYLPDRCADECISFVESNRDRPFFLCWWNYSVHYPFQAPDDLIAKYEKRKGPGIENPTYAAMIEGMDRSIGKLLDALDENDLTDNTLLIFTSDNGPFAANVKPLREEKGHLYEGGIRVPMIVRWPGHTGTAKQTATPVITMDIHATILEAADLKADSSNTPDGISLLPVLNGEQDLDRQSIYFHYPNYAFHKDNRLGSAVRSGGYKLIKFYDQDSVELYDLKNDIGETKDLSAQMPEKAKELRTDLESWLKETNASQPQNTQEISPRKRESGTAEQAAESEPDFNPDQSSIPATAPEGATVLLDDQTNMFLSRNGGPVDWPVVDGVTTSTKGGQNVNHLVSQVHFRDADIHVEFMLPEKGQGNSGIYIHGNYECQIFNSVGKLNPDMKDMGAVYGFQKPLINASREPGQWQVYDIRFRAPQRDDSGAITKPGSITSFLNGHKVQDGTEIGEVRSKYHPFRHGVTDYLNKIGQTKNKTMTGPLFLQDHNAPVQFRNVWLVPLDDHSFEYKPDD